MAAWPIRGSQPLSSPLVTCSFYSLSFLFLSSSLVHARPLSFAIFATATSSEEDTHLTPVKRTAEERPPEVSARDELLWSSSWPLKIMPPVVIFAEFRCLPTIFPDETTYFGMSIQPSTKPYLPCRSNNRRWKVSYYLHSALYGFFWWTGTVL